MKKGLKSALSVLLVLMLMLSVVQISVSAAQTTPMTIGGIIGIAAGTILLKIRDKDLER